MAALLKSHGMDMEKLDADVAAKADAVASDLRSGCINLPDPEPLDVFANVFASENSWLIRQRDNYARYLDGFADAGAKGGA